ncbi:MAG: gluconokinase [Chitinophagaceae bacterium]|nr:gluconokinase [Anaerolineae bacterium]
MTILVIDIGSSSVRALLFDPQARLIDGAVATRKYEFMTLPPGASIIDAPELRNYVEACMDEILKHPQASDIEAVGIDTFVGNVMGIDSSGNPLTPIYSYADIRSSEDVIALKSQIDLTETHQRTGCPHHTAYLPGRLHWLYRTGQADGVAKWVDFATYLYRCWFDNPDVPCSYSVATWSGLFNRDILAWDAKWLHMLNLKVEAFPPLSDYDKPQIGLSLDYRQRWPALRDVPFFLAVGDGAAANVGSGCVDQSHIALTLGTTAALRVITNQKIPVPAGLWSYRVNHNLHLIGGATSEGGNIFQWARETLALDDLTQMDAVIANQLPDSHGLTVLPLLAGERSPGWRADATGTIMGLRLSTTPLNIVHAALEGVALRLGLIAEQLASATSTQAVVIAGGGAINASPAWAQIITNAINRPLHLTSETELTARGTALLTLKALGKISSIDLLPTISSVLMPQPDAVEKLRQARLRQQDIYQRLYGAQL